MEKLTMKAIRHTKKYDAEIIYGMFPGITQHESLYYNCDSETARIKHYDKRYKWKN